MTEPHVIAGVASRRPSWLPIGFIALLVLICGCRGAVAETRDIALSGIVTSAREGSMEGVLVSARRQGSPVTVTVVADAIGRFAFPAARLSPGIHDITIRAVGFELAAPVRAEITAGRQATLDLSLVGARNLAAQLSNTEWLTSMPGTAEQKRPLIECMSCHTLERIARSTLDAAALYPVLVRMTRYANNSTMEKPQLRKVERSFNEATARKLAEYLASVNRSRGAWSYPLMTLPRPKGRATRVVITEYDLPRRAIAPHDVRTDDQGRVWYSNFVENILGRLDPATLEHREFPYAAAKPGFPEGSLALEAAADGSWWLSGMFQGGLYRFDPRTEVFRHFPLPAVLDHDAAQQSLLMPARAHVDGKVWTNDVLKQSILRLDIASGAYESIEPFRGLSKSRQHSPYGMVADAGNNLFFMDFADENVGRVDARTLRSTIYPTPTPRSRPRRAMIDEQGRVWFAEFAADKVAMFDPIHEAFREWDVPTPHTYPYDVHLDRNGELWSGSMSSDRVLRLNPLTGTSIEYLLPRQTNIRRVFVEPSPVRSVIGPLKFWTGSNHGGSIIQLEPED